MCCPGNSCKYKYKCYDVIEIKKYIGYRIEKRVFDKCKRIYTAIIYKSCQVIIS